ncbi:stress-responsive transcription factor hsf1 [Myotisia sp. PD_48]|nr:stress-responsive transcription factor hsf1 [Myotisia sp. PD_48]
MSSQGLSRKRPAPGTSNTISHPQRQPLDNLTMSNDQFLQKWGQNPSTNVNQPAVNTNIISAPDRPDASNQLTRRIGNQLISRGNPAAQSLLPLIDQSVARPPEPGSEDVGETDAEMMERALAVKKEAQAKRKQIPPFIQKLSSFLDSSKYRDLIRWSDDGNSFVVLDEDEFAKNMIPELFKHNNYASFVRQLNMYGFHKKVGLSDNSMRASERKNKSPNEYSNQYFKRGMPDLLWLIQKPKNIAGQAKGTAKAASRVKAETELDEVGETEESGEKAGGRDDRARFKTQLAIGAGESNTPDNDQQLANVYHELKNIRHQQSLISNTIHKLRREHEQLFNQATNFQEQHTRHENSINAILTFLATVYNRSLQSHEGSQGLTNSFAGAISQDQSLSNIVDVDELLGNYGSDTDQSQRPYKKQRLLLGAPPSQDVDRAQTESPSATSPYDMRRNHSSRPSLSGRGDIEELFDIASPGNQDTRGNEHQSEQKQRIQQQQQRPQSHQSERTPPPYQKNQDASTSASSYIPQRDIMSLIQNSNARHNFQHSAAEFPTVLSSLETSGGNSPLTAAQRADMLRLITRDNHNNDPSSQRSLNNALISPNAPSMPSNYPARLEKTRSEIDNLVKMQAEQARSMQNLTNMLQPLSPTGSIPGLEPGSNSVVPPPLDLDHIFNSGDYFSDFTNLAAKPGPEPSKAGIPSDLDTLHSNPTNDPLAPQAADLFDFDSLTAGASFENPNPILASDPSHNIPHSPNLFEPFDQLEGAGGISDLSSIGAGGDLHGFDLGAANAANTANAGQGLDSNRITETFTSSEATSPTGTSVDENHRITDNNARSRGPATRRSNRTR